MYRFFSAIQDGWPTEGADDAVDMLISVMDAFAIERNGPFGFMLEAMCRLKNQCLADKKRRKPAEKSAPAALLRVLAGWPGLSVGSDFMERCVPPAERTCVTIAARRRTYFMLYLVPLDIHFALFCGLHVRRLGGGRVRCWSFC